MRVLLIDDTRARARVLQKALQDGGYEVVQAAAGPLALMKAVERARPDVIIIDVDSPSRDVLEHIVVTSQNAPRNAGWARVRHQRLNLLEETPGDLGIKAL